jgi:hypothetical protein
MQPSLSGSPEAAVAKSLLLGIFGVRDHDVVMNEQSNGWRGPLRRGHNG